MVLSFKVPMYNPRIVKVVGSILGAIIYYPIQNLECSFVYKQKHAHNRKLTSQTLGVQNALLHAKNTRKNLEINSSNSSNIILV